MTEDEKLMFIELLFSHRHLWETFQEYRYLQEHPEVDWETAHEIYSEESHEVYTSLGVRFAFNRKRLRAISYLRK